MTGWFITGTDTGVGKTRVAAGLIAALRSRGVKALGMKPVACGLVSEGGVHYSEDVDAICHSSGQKPASFSLNPYKFIRPVSPHIAAELEGKSIELDVIVREFSTLAADGPVVVEGAGGWEVPISDSQSMADVARALQLPVVLVVGLRLGCLNHALLTARAIAATGLPLAGWIGNRIDEDFAESEANLATLCSRLGSTPLAVLPYSHSPRSALPALGEAATHLLGAAHRAGDR